MFTILSLVGWPLSALLGSSCEKVLILLNYRCPGIPLGIEALQAVDGVLFLCLLVQVRQLVFR